MQSVFHSAKTLTDECSSGRDNLPTHFFKVCSLRRDTQTDAPPTSSFQGCRQGQPPDTVLQGMQPSAAYLNERPPDTVLQGMQPSEKCLRGRHLDTGNTSRYRPSSYAAFGRILKQTAPRHRPARYANKNKLPTPFFKVCSPRQDT